MILKGIAAAQYYDCPEARTYGDIDILITNEDTFNIAVSELQKFGYKPIKDYGELTFQANLACGSRHFEFKRKDVEVEIHSRYHEIAKVLKLYLNAKKWRKIEGSRYPSEQYWIE